jgi:hypothetical protein
MPFPKKSRVSPIKSRKNRNRSGLLYASEGRYGFGERIRLPVFASGFRP